MKIKWECADCEILNDSNVPHWKSLRDGVFFESRCEDCGAKNKVEIEVNTKTI